MDRRVTYLTVRALEQQDGRYIEGWATTPSTDRIGDIVDPTGAKFSLPLPLLFAHRHDEPIGSVVAATVTKAGIRVRAKIAAGVRRADEVWQLIRDGALHAVSIGFQALKSSPLPSGGMRFESWEWHELSIVSVPANPDAKISVAKCIAYADPSVPRRERVASLPSGDLPDPSLIGTVIGTGIKEAIAPLIRRLDALERANAELRDDLERKTWRYRGYWAEGMECRMGEFVTDGGSLWVCLTDTRERPAHNTTAWRIAARKGRDGK